MAVRLSGLHAGRPLPPRRFLVLIFLRSWVDPRAIVGLEGLDKLKKKFNLIGTRTGDLTACSIMSQSTTLPCTPNYLSTILSTNLPIVGYRSYPFVTGLSLRIQITGITLADRIMYTGRNTHASMQFAMELWFFFLFCLRDIQFSFILNHNMTEFTLCCPTHGIFKY
jgi:hypothetical protein